MKLVITKHVEKQFKGIGLQVDDLIAFLKQNPEESKRFIKLCSPLKGVTVYKAYLDKLRRVVFFVHHHGLIYPVYAGDKKDLLAKNITVPLVRKYAQHWQDRILQDVEAQQYKVRHY